MKTINNTCLEVLPGLLDKSKTQTIRPAWKDCYDLIKEEAINVEQSLPRPAMYKTIKGTNFVEKPSKYKVGEIVKQVWNQRSKYKWFDSKTGKAIEQPEIRDLRKGEDSIRLRNAFKKHLGNVEIIEVFKIEIYKFKIGFGIRNLTRYVTLSFGSPFLREKQVEDLAKRDGFSTVEQMFEYLDKNYDLSTPKEFWVSRYKWRPI